MVKYCKIDLLADPLTFEMYSNIRRLTQQLIGQNLAVCGPSASSHSPHASLMAVWILRVENKK